MPYLTVKTYDELRKYIRAFRSRHIGLLIIASNAGLGKTSIVEEELETEAPLFLNSHITPLSFYQNLFEKVSEENDCLIVIDEAEMMFQDAKLKTMLKLLCDTRKEKVVQYNSTTPLLKKLPKEIRTEAKVVMLINTLTPSDENIKAIMSRGHLLNFEPPNYEVVNHLCNDGWATDKEVLKFIKSYANVAKSFSLRAYVKALESKKSRLDWEKEVINELEVEPRLLIIQRLLRNMKSDTARIKEWENITGQDRRTYYRYKKIYVTKVLGKKLDDDYLDTLP